MYCKCSKGYNYQVVGVCDAGKIIITDEKPWTQITIPEILPLPECYPDIEDIERIYINVVIESARVIETPDDTDGNEEGMKLTGYKLIVDGNICETIVYTADNCEQSLHSVNFKFPFCTYIVLPENTNLEDKYCVEYCIEDVYAQSLNPRTMFKSVALFLIAEKAEPICPQDNEISGSITNNTGVATVVTITVYDEHEVPVAVKIVDVGKLPSHYSIEGLCNGTYKIVFAVEDGFSITPTQTIVTLPPTPKKIDAVITKL